MQGRIVEENTEPDVRSAVKVIVRQSRRALLRNWGQRIGIVCMLLILGFIVFAIMERAGVFRESVERTLTAGIYLDGAEVGETTVTLSGERSTLGKHRYRGRFAIDAVEGTESAQALVRWDDETDCARIWYHDAGLIASDCNDDLEYFFYCGHEMDWFALTLSDGRIIATGEGSAQLQSLRPFEYPIRTE